MITIVGTNHRDFKENELELDDAVRLSHYDHIFTEGFSEDGLNMLDNEVQKIVEQNNELKEEDASELVRGPEPQALEAETDAEITYLDEGISQEVLEDVARAALEKGKEKRKNNNDEVTPYPNLNEILLTGEPDRSDYLDFFEDLRDGKNYVFQSYAAISEDGFEQMIDHAAEEFDDSGTVTQITVANNSQEFLEGLEEYDVTFEDYINTYAEVRREFQDQRDQEWYEQIDEQIDEDEHTLIVTGIQHALDYEDTVRNHIQENYDDLVVLPYRHNQLRNNEFQKKVRE